MALRLGRSRICGGLSLLWSAIKKSRPLFGVAVPAKKSGACARVPQAFSIASASCFSAFVGDTRGAIIRFFVMFFERSKGVCFKEKPLG